MLKTVYLIAEAQFHVSEQFKSYMTLSLTQPCSSLWKEDVEGGPLQSDDTDAEDDDDEDEDEDDEDEMDDYFGDYYSALTIDDGPGEGRLR